MAAILLGLTDVSSALLTIVGDVVAAVVAAPLLLIPLLMGFVGSGIGIFSRLRHG